VEGRDLVKNPTLIEVPLKKGGNPEHNI